MPTHTEPTVQSRVPLTRDRILREAVELADRDGIGALTMRNLAHALGVEAMSLYYHVENKEALLDGVAEVIVGDILEAVDRVEGPRAETDWKGAMRTRILTAREVLIRHKWAPEVIESRTVMNPPTILYFEGLLEIFRQGGFSYDLAHHALHALGSRALGFTQELFNPDDAENEEASNAMFAELAPQLPHLVGMITELSHDDPDSTLGWCDDQTEFEFGLDLILDGLDRLK